MADRYWVGGTGTWDAATTTNWSASSGGAGGASVPTSSDAVFFDSGSGTAATVTINGGGAAASITINKSDLTLTHTTGSTVAGAVTLTTGTLNTNGATCSWGSFSSSNSNTRTLTLGSSAITLSSISTAWNAGTATNLTVTANTATVTLSGAGGTFASASNVNWNGMSLSFTGSGNQSYNAYGNTFANFTRTGTAVKTDGLWLWNNPTVTGTFTVTGNSAVNRVLVASNTVGTARTITAANASLTNVDFRDITGAGAATWSGTSIGNAGGNTNITFTTPVTCTHTAGAAGNWSTAAEWDTGTVPLCHDTVVIPATVTGTLTNDMPRMGADITFASGFAGTFAQNTAADIYGSLTLAASMTVSGTAAITFRGRGSHTITTAGDTVTFGCTFDNSTGTYTLADAFTNNRTAAGALTLTSGTFNDGGFTITLSGAAASFVQSGGTLTLSGTTNINSTTAATPWSVTAGTVNHTGTIVLGGNTTTARTFAGGGKTYGTLRDTNTSTGSLAVTGSNTFGTLDVQATAARTLTLPAAGTTTITNQLNLEAASGVRYFNGTTGDGSMVLHNVGTDWSSTTLLDVRVKARAVDWSAAAVQILAASYDAGFNARVWYFGLTTGGELTFVYSADGITPVIKSTSGLGLVNGQDYHLGVVFDPDDGAGQTAVTFYTSTAATDDAYSVTDWAPVGSTLLTAPNITLHNALVQTSFGQMFSGFGYSSTFVGRLYSASITRNGSLLFHWKATDFPPLPELGVAGYTEVTAVTGQTLRLYTENGSCVWANGPLTVTGDVTKASGTVLGSNLLVSGSDAGGGATFLALDSIDGGTNTGWLFDARGGVGALSGLGTLTATGLREVHGSALFEGVGAASGTGEDYLYVPFRSAFSSAAPTDRLAAVPLSGVP